MSDIGSANIRITGSSTGFVGALEDARKKAGIFVREMNSNVARSFRDADAQQRIFRSGLTRLGGELQSIGQKLTLFGSLPAIFAAGAAYKTFADLEKLKIGLGQYGESLTTVRELAKLPNVSIEGAAQTLLQLRAVGVESQFAQRTITAFANALTAAGRSSADLNPALTNIVQMLSTGVVSAADVKELANRVPQARKALIDAFGTASGEELTKKGVSTVVEKLVAELEKIPPVAGGAGMALEKLGDDSKFGLATIGESLDKSFGITGTLNSLSESIGTLTEKFQSLDPKTQKAVFALAGMAVVIPTLITALGGAITLIGLFAAGVGLTASTVLGLSVAVAVAGTAIIANWGDIKESVGDTAIWKTLADISGSTLNALVELFKVAANLITGDWSNLGISLINVLKNIGNAGVSIIGGLLKILPSALGLVTGVDTSFLTKGVDRLVKALTIDVPNSVGVSSAALDNLRKKFDNALGGIGNIPKTNPKAAKGNSVKPFDLTELGFVNWQIDLASKFYKEKEAVKAATNQYKELVGVVKSLNVERLKLSNTTESIIGTSRYSRRQLAEDRLKSIGDYKIDQTAGILEKANNKRFKDQNTGLEATSELNDFFAGKVGLKEIQDYFSGIVRIAGESDNAYADRVYSIVDKTKMLSAGLTSALREAASDAAAVFGELLGNLATGAGGVENFGKRVLGSLANMLKEMGKSLIGAGTAGLALKVFAKNPALALVAGIGLVALGTATANKLQKQADTGLTKFAQGGAAYRQMVAVIGDNQNARHDPEIVSPYSKIDDSIAKSVKNAGGMGPQVFITDLRIEGSEFVIGFNRAQDSNFNLRGF